MLPFYYGNKNKFMLDQSLFLHWDISLQKKVEQADQTPSLQTPTCSYLYKINKTINDLIIITNMFSVTVIV